MMLRPVRDRVKPVANLCRCQLSFFEAARPKQLSKKKRGRESFRLVGNQWVV